MNGVPVIDVIGLAAEKDSVFLLDVRELKEAAVCAISDAVLIPLGQLPERVGELPKDRPIVVHCHHGGRSARAVQYLLGQGFGDVRNLAGGIDAWAVQIEPEMPRY